MGITYSAQRATFNSTSPPDDLDDLVTAVGNSSICDLLIPEARVFFLEDISLYFSTATSKFEDSEFALYHSKDTSFPTPDRAFYWDDSTPGTVEWGKLDNTVPTKPIVWGDSHYFYDNLMSSPGNIFWGYHTSGSMSDGTLRVYGGIFEDLPRGSTSNGQFLYLPETETLLIGVNFERWGGHRTWGTNYAVRECIFKGGDNASPGTNSGPYGFSLGGVTTIEDGMFDIIIEENCYGYYFYAANGGTLRGARLRNNDSDLQFNSTTSGMTVNLIDCDPYTNCAGSNSSGDVYEYTSYNLTCLEADGSTPIEGARVRVWRDTPSTEYVTSGGISGELTAADGHPTSSDELLLLNTFLESATFGDQDQYGPYFLRARDYGRKFVLEAGPQQITPAPPIPIVHDLLMPCTGLMDDNCVDTNVSAYTGIAVNTTANTVTLTEAHTIKSIYSYVQYYFSLAAQIDEDDLGITTYDGKLYTVTTGWTISGEDTNMTLDLNLFELANGDRWVPIYLTGMQEYASFLIKTTAEAELYSGEVDTTEEYLTKRKWLSSDINIYTWCKLQGYRFFSRAGAITNKGLIVPVNLEADPSYKFPFGRLRQTHFRWRDDDGSESGATWLQNEDVNHTNLAKTTNIRLRIQVEEFRSKPNINDLKCQFQKDGNTVWEDIS